MKVKKLDWDSDFFNLIVGEIENPTTKELLLTENFDLIYVKAEAESEITIKNFEKTFSENKVIFSKQITKENQKNQNIFSIPEVQFNINEIYNLAFESGKMSRFKLDKNFSHLKFEQLYKKWVDNSLNKLFADEVLLYQENNKTLGFVTYKTTNNLATIGLIAVDSKSQGKGIGGKLIDFVEKNLFLSNIETLHIPTQLENQSACKFYIKKGYQIVQKTYISHYWKK